MPVSKGLIQAYELQDIAHSVCKALVAEMKDEKGNIIIRRDEYGKPVDTPAIAQLIKSWESAQQRVSFHRRVPSPGVLKPDGKTKRSRIPKRAPAGPMSVLPEPIPMPEPGVSAS